MKKISIRFNSISKVQKLKKILKKIHSKGTDQIKDIAKFTLAKNIIPQNVDHAELELFSKDSSEVVTIAKQSLTFMSGDNAVLTKISSEDTTEQQYIVLPWNLNSQTDKDNLRELIGKISSKTRAIKYTIYVNNLKINTGVTNFGIDDFSESENSITQLELSELSYGGHMEELLDKIELLERDVIKSNYIINEHEMLLKQRENRISDLSSEIANLNNQVNQKQGQISSLTTQVNNLTNQTNRSQGRINSLNGQVSNLTGQVNNLTTQRNTLQNQLQTHETWSVTLPRPFVDNITVPNRIFFSKTAKGSGITTHLTVNNVQGNVTLDIPTRMLTVVGHCGVVNGY